LTQKEIKKCGADDEVFTAITGFMSSINNVRAVLMLREEGDGTVKGSLRSTDPDADISKLAVILGGGGHPKSSGFALSGKITLSEKFYQIV
jgi:nanoRNase/pAp phosphatase (c-di-AMP/oligoRNAs hydrolase)